MRVLYNIDTGVIDIEGLGQISDVYAIELATQLVFLTKGYLVKNVDNGKIVDFNYDHPFFIEYAKLMGLEI